MISKAKIKYVHSLEQKKHRMQEGVFLAEGIKTVGDLLAVMPAREIFATHEWVQQNPSLAKANATSIVTVEELSRLSFQQHPQQVLGIFDIPHQSPNINHLSNEMDGVDPINQLSLALDGVQDPGNMGTILRIADWFGIETIYCSHDTADIYNPKVVQATMGSIARVRVIYTDLANLIDTLPDNIPVYGTLLNGENIYTQTLTPNGIIVMGNEGRGISPTISSRISHRLLIPSFPKDRATADSLNVAIATAITCAEFRRCTLARSLQM